MTAVYKYSYPLLVAIIYLIWGSYMLTTNQWAIFNEYWPISLTMSLGSFVAGATPLGGATVAFPVFTKLLHIPTPEARTFGLMIQAVGMSMATVLILSRHIKVLPHVVGWTTLGGIVGLIWGSYFGQIPPPLPKILFTIAVTAFGVVLALTQWWFRWQPQPDIPNWHSGHRLLFGLCGILGGIFSANTGAGTDMFAFILMTLAFGISARIATPTTVIIMALNSLVGFLIHGILRDPGEAWHYWLVAVPIVILGAPFGAFVASKIKQRYLIIFILALILIELSTTLWLVPFDVTAIQFSIAALLMYLVGFSLMIKFHSKQRYAHLTHS